jgi:phage terminase large subunit-like protein
MADCLTKKARKFKRKSTYMSLPQNPIDFTINDITINSKYALRSKKAFHSISLRSYFQDKHSWKNHTIDNIWWKTYHNSITKLNLPEKTIIYKFIHDRLPTRSRDHKYYNYRDKQCPLCQSDNEDEDHILRCFSIKRRKAREEWLKELSDYLSKNHTPIEVKQLLMKHLLHWLEPATNTLICCAEEKHELKKALQQQSIIGWKNLLEAECR